MIASSIKERLSMTRFRFYLPFAACLLASGSMTRADDVQKNAKKEVAFGIDVARRGLWQEARFRFQQATTMNPDYASAFNNLGVTLEQQGDFEKARAAYERALQLEPKNISIQQNFDLFREADEKRNKKLKKDAAPAKTDAAPKAKESPTPPPAAPPMSGQKGMDQ
jgi:Flp pilus assembly protein TadD